MQFAHFQFDPQEDRLGEGPLSEVYRAEDLDLGRKVALKILRAHAEIDPAADRRFQREAKHTSNLQHPNIATVYEYGRDQGTSFIAMEYLEGRTLDRILKDRALSFDECLRIFLQVTSALALVHRSALIHRDLKPGNIMVQHDGAVKLLDFGIARAAAEGSITQHGMLVGTVLYMSPEQVRGDELDVRSDVFALGAVMYHAATGQLPFPGKSFPEVCMAILDGRPRPPSQVRLGFPPALEALILRCLAPDPRERCSNAGSVHDALLEMEGQTAAANGVAPSAALTGKVLLPPVRCGGEHPEHCSVLAGSLRKDVLAELARIRGLTVHLIDDEALPHDGDYDFVVRMQLDVDGGRGLLDTALEHYPRSANGNGAVRPREAFSDRVEYASSDEWDLQAGLVRGLVRTLRKRMAEVAAQPVQEARRDVEASRLKARRAADVLHRATSKHLLKALSTFRSAIDDDPYNARAYAGMAEALVRKFLYYDGDDTFLDEAREHAAKALAIDPGCAEAHTALGFAFHLSGHLTEGQREYRRAMQLDHGEWLAHRLLGALLARRGNLKEASPLLQRAIALHPTHIGSYDHLFSVLQRLDRYEEAIQNADRGIAVARAHLAEVPDNQEARLSMALLLARMGLADDARTTLVQAHEQAPKDGYTSFQTACVHAVLGEVPEALDALRTAQERGYHIQSELLRNSDLEILRGLPEFQALVA